MIYFYKPQKFILLFYSLVNCFLTFAEEWWPQPSTRNHEDRHQERQLRWKVICSHTLAHWLIDSKVTGRWWLQRNLSPLETATAPTRPWRTFFFLPLPPCFHYTLPPTSNARCFASASLCVSAAQQMVRVYFSSHHRLLCKHFRTAFESIPTDQRPSGSCEVWASQQSRRKAGAGTASCGLLKRSPWIGNSDVRFR